ncbi:hypothetical protein HZA39_00680 [Candidatus Peregrinibacteria bacterium]|nr:hypothetical protein [Candidatus Peregrinibacteria bacterium]
MKGIFIMLLGFLMFSCEGRQVGDYFYHPDAEKHQSDAYKAIEPDVSEAKSQTSDEYYLDATPQPDTSIIPDDQISQQDEYYLDAAPQPDINTIPDNQISQPDEYYTDAEAQTDGECEMQDSQPDEYCSDAALQSDSSAMPDDQISQPDINIMPDEYNADTTPETAETAVEDILFAQDEIESAPEEIVQDTSESTQDVQETGQEEIPNLCECTIYTNTTVGFAFAYPENWMIVYDDGVRVDLDSKPNAGEDETDRIYVSIEVMQNNTGGPDSEWIMELMERFVDTVALDEKAVKVDIFGTGEHLGIYTVIPLKNAVVGVSMRYLYPEFEKIPDAKIIFAKIIASFTNI